MQNWIKLRKIGVTELIFVLLVLEAPWWLLFRTINYAVAMVTGDDAMWLCFGSLMIELVPVTKKLQEKIFFFFESFKCQSARKPKNYCEPP